MSKFDIVRAWKDQEYYNSLAAKEQALVPENPAGVIDLSEDDLSGIVGAGTDPQFSAGCPCPPTVNDQLTCIFPCLVTTVPCAGSMVISCVNC